ncbi:ShlB/FhaC/HecB family hemolysin secretion/activation protein, partial [Candidatus Omnitrophota bacterium]
MKKFLFIITILCIAVYAAHYPAAYGQLPPESAVDSATRDVDRDIREKAEEKLITPPKKGPKIEEEPEEKVPEGPKFFIKKINLIGTVSVSPEEFQPIIDKYENKEVSVGELNILAKEIERDYLRKGIIAACFLPPQEVKDGEVTLQAVEAKMGALQIRQDSKLFDDDILRRYWTIKPGEVLRYDKMSRSVQLMNKNPDRDVNATLHAGKEPETTDVLLNVTTHFPIHLTASFDREGSVSTGRERTGLGIRHNNFLFVDDTLIIGGTFGKAFTSTYFYHSIPITNCGTTLMYGYSDSKAQPKKEFERFAINSRAQNSSVYMYQDIYKGADYMGEVSMGLDAKDKVVTTVDGTSNRDRFRIISFKSNLIHRYPGCITYINPQLSQGLNFLGARSKNPLSSRGADSTFTKFNLGITHKRALPLNLQASLKFKCQWASEKLASQEEFYMGGIDSVRGYTSGEYLADNAIQTNFEL